MRVGARITWIVGALACGLSLRGVAQTSEERIRADLVAWLARERPPATLTALQRTRASVWSLTRRFYRERDFRAVWRAEGTGADLGSMLPRLRRAAEQGLDSTDYPWALLQGLAQSRSDPDSLALLDLVATIAYFGYATDLSLGRVVPGAVDSMWAAADRQLDLAARLAGAIDSGRVEASLVELAPPQSEAARLRAALARYRAIAATGGWEPIPGRETLVLGASGMRIQLLRRRLEITGDVAPGGGSQVFDSALEAGVRLAQSRHGLTADGVAGPRTLAALNVPVAARIRQLELNLERWRWVPRDLGQRYISVNSADYSLEVVDSGRRVLSSRVVAGQVTWPTPIVSGLLTEVTFNPRWNIPRSIAVTEILPRLQRGDVDFLRREAIHVTDTAAQATELDPAAIDWGTVSAGSFAYRLWQEAGPQNPLGRIRFVIRNRFGVALHDTPFTHLFNGPARAYSHGCVRVEAAESLAAYLLRDRPGWTADSICAVVGDTTERSLAIAEPPPVVIGYWTAWLDRDGVVQFRPDVYGWDAELDAALSRRVRALP